MTKLALVLAVIFIVGPVYAESKSSKNTSLPTEGKIYNSHGQLQQTWKTQPAGDRNTKYYNKHGQLEYYVKPDGTIMNKHGQKIGEIKPGNK